MRQATAEDLLVFTSQTIIGTLANPQDPTSINGVAVPLADKWVLTPEEQASTGVSPEYVRVSVGIEDADDIIADLDQALRATA